MRNIDCGFDIQGGFECTPSQAQQTHLTDHAYKLEAVLCWPNGSWREWSMCHPWSAAIPRPDSAMGHHVERQRLTGTIVWHAPLPVAHLQLHLFLENCKYISTMRQCRAFRGRIRMTVGPSVGMLALTGESTAHNTSLRRDTQKL